MVFLKPCLNIFVNEQEQLMDNLLNTDLEIVDTVRELKQQNWSSVSLQGKIDDLLNLRDEMVQKLMSFNEGHHCDCGHQHE